jgi:hypothetical protein
MQVNGMMIAVISHEFIEHALTPGYYPGGGHATVSFKPSESVAWYSVHYNGMSLKFAADRVGVW